MKLARIAESDESDMEYDHSHQDTDIPDVAQAETNEAGYHIAPKDVNSPWLAAGWNISLDTQLVSTIRNLLSNGYMTVGSCRGYPEELGSSCGYVNITGSPVPPKLIPQLGQPQKTYDEILQFCHATSKMIPGGSIHENKPWLGCFLCWPWHKCGAAIKAINTILGTQ